MHITTTKTLASRRRFLRGLAATGGFFAISGLYSEALALVAPQLTQGPFYPLADDIPLDKDNDLVQLGDSTTPAAGQVHYLGGRILDASGNPVRNALVELWHADREGDYSYSAAAGRNPACDANFAGFGQFLTGRNGAYRFRTVKAGLYNGRTRHYHIAVTIPGQNTRYTTQTGWNETAIALNGSTWATQNSNDSIFRNLTAAQRTLLLLDYAAVPDAAAGEVAASFDFQVGLTPTEPTYPDPGGFVARGKAVAGPASSTRFGLTFPAYPGYTYEVYGNPTMGALEWGALPFSLAANGAIDRNKHTATAEAPLSLYVDAPATRGFYYVSFRPPGANTGTP